MMRREKTLGIVFQIEFLRTSISIRGYQISSDNWIIYIFETFEHISEKNLKFKFKIETFYH